MTRAVTSNRLMRAHELAALIGIDPPTPEQAAVIEAPLGAAVVIASGLYLVHRERIAHRESIAGPMEQQAAL